MGKGGREVSLSVYIRRFPLHTTNIGKCTITPSFDCFSISTEILIDFGLTLFTVLTHSDDNRENEVPSPSPKAYNLIIGNRKQQQSDKP